MLVPSAGGLRDLATMVPGWVSTYDGALRPGDLRAALDTNPSGSPDLTAFDWGPIALQTLDFYRSVQSTEPYERGPSGRGVGPGSP